MRMIKDYMNNDALRHELNALTEATFGFNFEGWVTNGYFEGDYIPYSFEEDGKIISNVSANIMQFKQNGRNRNYIQIGTVMTDIGHRKKGLARKLMEHVIDEYKEKCDGFYLFGDLSALDFYRKMGFTEKKQYIYTLKEDIIPKLKGRFAESDGFKVLEADDAEARESYIESVRNSVPNSAFEQMNKYGLQMFHTFKSKNIYYSKKLDCFTVMKKKGEAIEIYSVISQKRVPLENIIGEINMEYTGLKLGFTPRREEAHLFECTPFDGGDDYRLFCLGEQLDSIEKEKLYFPAFSHA